MEPHGTTPDAVRDNFAQPGEPGYGQPQLE